MNPATRAQKKDIVKILNDADVDPETGDSAILPIFFIDTETTFQRSSSHPHRCTFFLLPTYCAKISRSLHKTLT